MVYRIGLRSQTAYIIWGMLHGPCNILNMILGHDRIALRMPTLLPTQNLYRVNLDNELILILKSV